MRKTGAKIIIILRIGKPQDIQHISCGYIKLVQIIYLIIISTTNDTMFFKGTFSLNYN